MEGAEKIMENSKITGGFQFTSYLEELRRDARGMQSGFPGHALYF